MGAAAAAAAAAAPRGPDLALLLGAVMVFTAAAPSSSLSPPPAKLPCWFVEEAARGGSVMPSDLKQRPALLILPPPGRRVSEADLESELPPEVEAGLAFQILDPSGMMWGGSGGSSRPLWLESGPDSEEAAEGAVSCEVNPYTPQEAHVAWAAGLVGREGCPRSLEGGRWFIATVQSPAAGFGVSTILHEDDPSLFSPPGKRHEAAAVRSAVVTTATAVLSIFTRTPLLRSRLGEDVVIDCGFSGPASPFSVEWRHQHGGAGRVILAYDGAAGKISVSEDGARLFLDPESGNVSLRLQEVGVRHEGTYICTVYLPHLHAQQAMELKVLEPPKVTLRPIPLSAAPNARVELSCEVSGYFPQSASVVWRRRGPGEIREDLVGTWESGHHQSPDGTYRFTSYASLPSVRPEDHNASFSCHVSHPALGEAGLRKSVTLQVAGFSGPSMEDVIGCFLIAFALFGFLQAFFRWAMKPDGEQPASGEKKKSKKVE